MALRSFANIDRSYERYEYDKSSERYLYESQKCVDHFDVADVAAKIESGTISPIFLYWADCLRFNDADPVLLFLQMKKFGDHAIKFNEWWRSVVDADLVKMLKIRKNFRDTVNSFTRFFPEAAKLEAMHKNLTKKKNNNENWGIYKNDSIGYLAVATSAFRLAMRELNSGFTQRAFELAGLSQTEDGKWSNRQYSIATRIAYEQDIYKVFSAACKKDFERIVTFNVSVKQAPKVEEVLKKWHSVYFAVKHEIGEHHPHVHFLAIWEDDENKTKEAKLIEKFGLSVRYNFKHLNNKRYKKLAIAGRTRDVLQNQIAYFCNAFIKRGGTNSKTYFTANTTNIDNLDFRTLKQKIYSHNVGLLAPRLDKQVSKYAEQLASMLRLTKVDKEAAAIVYKLIKKNRNKNVVVSFKTFQRQINEWNSIANEAYLNNLKSYTYKMRGQGTRFKHRAQYKLWHKVLKENHSNFINMFYISYLIKHKNKLNELANDTNLLKSLYYTVRTIQKWYESNNSKQQAHNYPIGITYITLKPPNVA